MRPSEPRRRRRSRFGSFFLPAPLAEPEFDHGEPVASPKWLAIDEDPRRPKDTARNGILAMPTGNRFDLGIGHSRKEHLGIKPKPRCHLRDCCRIVGVKSFAEIAANELLGQSYSAVRIRS